MVGGRSANYSPGPDLPPALLDWFGNANIRDFEDDLLHCVVIVLYANVGNSGIASVGDTISQVDHTIYCGLELILKKVLCSSSPLGIERAEQLKQLLCISVGKVRGLRIDESLKGRCPTAAGVFEKKLGDRRLKKNLNQDTKIPSEIGANLSISGKSINPRENCIESLLLAGHGSASSHTQGLNLAVAISILRLTFGSWEVPVVIADL